MSLTIEISNGKQGVLRPVPVQDVPEADNSNSFAHKLDARAQLCAVYAGVLGVDLARIDVLEILQARTTERAPQQQEAHAMAAALRQAGLDTEIAPIARVEQATWPALAYMTSGQVLLVLGQARDALIVYDTTCTDNRALIPLSEFKPFFAGLVLRAHAPLAKVEQVHNLAPRSNHWFWGQFGRFKRQLAEIALGSFVANLLAVAVALFSLQVYDRVIPHQSEATLWVLAIGAGLALLLEAFIKIARARLMDGAGRQIELSVLNTLMARVLGTRSDAKGGPASMRFSQMR